MTRAEVGNRAFSAALVMLVLAPIGGALLTFGSATSGILVSMAVATPLGLAVFGLGAKRGLISTSVGNAADGLLNLVGVVLDRTIALDSMAVMSVRRGERSWSPHMDWTLLALRAGSSMTGRLTLLHESLLQIESLRRESEFLRSTERALELSLAHSRALMMLQLREGEEGKRLMADARQSLTSLARVLVELNPDARQQTEVLRLLIEQTRWDASLSTRLWLDRVPSQRGGEPELEEALAALERAATR